MGKKWRSDHLPQHITSFSILNPFLSARYLASSRSRISPLSTFIVIHQDKEISSAWGRGQNRAKRREEMTVDSFLFPFFHLNYIPFSLPFVTPHPLGQEKEGIISSFL